MSAAPLVFVHLTGRLSARVAGATYTGAALGSRRGRQLLAVLAVRRGTAVSADALADVLWPADPPSDPARVVAALVSRLRAVLGRDVLVGDRHGYQLAGPDTVVLDLDQAAEQVDAAAARLDAGEPGLACTLVAEPLRLLGASGVLEDEPEAPWAEDARVRHTLLLRRARHLAAASLLAVGRVGEAADAARAALSADPLDEEAARLLMAASAVTGDQAGALRTFETLRHDLADSLGVLPGRATQRVHAAVLRGADPAPYVAPVRNRPRAGDPALAGRAEETGRLRTAWEAAASGRGGLVLVAGEPGIGKTTLAAHLAALAAGTGGVVLGARCFEAERSLFLQPFADALEAAGGSLDPDLLRSATGPDTDVLAALVPHLAGPVGADRGGPGLPEKGRGGAGPHAEGRGGPGAVRSGPGGPGGGPDGQAAPLGRQRRAVFAAVAGFLDRMARRAPVLLWLDDLHQAGRATVELVHYLHRVADRGRLLVVATVRDVEGEPVLAHLDDVAAVLSLGPLSGADVHVLAESAGQGAQSDAIHRRTGGHPLFVVQVLHDLASGGQGLPVSLQAALVDRVQGLGEPAQVVLRAGAVLGAAFDPLEAAALAGLPPADALESCERALRARLLVDAGREYAFANDLVREALYAAMPAPARVSYHRLAADLLAGRPEEVARHAAAGGDPVRAARSLVVAAESALRRFAARDAEDLATEALALAATSDEQAGELVGLAHVVRGQARDALTDWAGAFDDVTDAVTVARVCGDRRLEMVALRELAGDIVVALGRPPAECGPPLRRILSLAESLGDRVRQADALSRLAVLAGARLDFAEGTRLAAQAELAASMTPDPVARMHALDARKNISAHLGEVSALALAAAELGRMLRAAGDLRILQWVVFESSFVPLAAGRYAEAEDLMREAWDLSRRSGYHVQESWFVAHLGWLRRLSGDLPGALQLGGQSLRLAERHGAHPWWWPAAVTLYAGSLLAAGRRDAAVEALRPLGAAEQAGSTPQSTPQSTDAAYRARVQALLAEATGAPGPRAEADRLLRGVTAPPGCAWLAGADAYLATARAWVSAGEPDRADDLLRPFVAAARRNGWDQVVLLADQAATPLQRS